MSQVGVGTGVKFAILLTPSSSPEADAALHLLQDASLGSVTVYVVPETSSLLPQVGSSTLGCQCLRTLPIRGALGEASVTRLFSSVLAGPSPAPSQPSSLPFPQGISVYVGKHRSALVKAGGGLAALRTRLRQLTQVMSFTASSIAAVLSDRVPDGQLGPDTRRHLKSSLGTDVHPSPVS